MAEADKIAIGERIVVGPTDALLVIDVQPTFMPGGGLAVQGGDEVVPVIRDLMPMFPIDLRIATKDRHPRGHISLASSYVGVAPMTVLTEEMVDGWFDPNRSEERIASHAKFSHGDLIGYLACVHVQVLWPDHAIAGTEEAELHLGLGGSLRWPEGLFDYVLVKGTHPCEDSYSGFKGNAGTPTELADVLRERGVTRIFVCGLALDYCVRFTAEGGKDAGFEVAVIVDATRAVSPDKADKVYAALREKGIRLIQSEHLVEPVRIVRGPDEATQPRISDVGAEQTAADARARRSEDICGN